MIYNFSFFTSSELIRNQTLKFLSKTLPVLKADDTLPKVTQIPQDEVLDTFENNNGCVQWTIGDLNFSMLTYYVYFFQFGTSNGTRKTWCRYST